MSRSSTRPYVIAFAVIAALIATAFAVWAFLRWLRRPLTPVPRVDLDRLGGTWYPIALSPAAHRRVAPGPLTVTHQGLGLLDITVNDHGGGGAQTRRIVALATEGGASIKLDSGPFGRSLAVLALAPDYSACLLGSPDRTVAVILARERTLDRTLWRFFRDELGRQDFRPDRLRQVSGTRVALAAVPKPQERSPDVENAPG